MSAMARKDAAFLRAIIDGDTWRDAAQSAGLSEEAARRFLESIERFAGTVGAEMEFGLPDGDPSEDSGQRRGDTFVVHTDGSSLGNPGPAGAAAVILSETGEIVAEAREHLGTTTSNVAEYAAVRLGLERALELGARRIIVRLDSELVANQLMGRYRVKDPKLLERYLEVEGLLSRLEDVKFEAIPRERNAHADRLAQLAAREESS